MCEQWCFSYLPRVDSERTHLPFLISRRSVGHAYQYPTFAGADDTFAACQEETTLRPVYTIVSSTGVIDATYRALDACGGDLNAIAAISISFLRLAHRWFVHSDSILANVLLWADPQAHARKELWRRIVSNTVAGHA